MKNEVVEIIKCNELFIKKLRRSDMKNSRIISSVKFISGIIIYALILFHPKATKAQFAKGADVSWLSQMESSGRTFNDNSGIQKDCLDILKSKGINALRFRVWVNPIGNFNNKKDVAYMVLRAKNKGFDVMIDFHMSDSWADPGKQTKPAAWSTHSFYQLKTDVYDHVYSVLDTLKSIGVIPKWVQIGNETNDGMLWEDGRAYKNMGNFAALIKSGYSAVKAIDSTIQVIVHLSNGYDNNMYRWLFDGLKYYGAEWDIIGMSVYPYGSKYPSWIVYNGYAQLNMWDLNSRYNTKIMVCEAGYPYNQPVEAKNYLLDLIDKTKSAGGLGVFYWEPECYNWQNYGLGAWDPVTKQPTIAMDAFLDSTATEVAQGKIIPNNYDIKIYPNPFNPSTTIQYSISKASNVLLLIYDSMGRLVKSLVKEYKSPGEYSVRWYGIGDNGMQCSSGIYFVNLNADTEHQIRKMILLK